MDRLSLHERLMAEKRSKLCSFRKHGPTYKPVLGFCLKYIKTSTCTAFFFCNFFIICFLLVSRVCVSALLASGGNDLVTELLNSSAANLPKETFLNPHTSSSI